MYTWIPASLLITQLLTGIFSPALQPWFQDSTPGKVVDLRADYSFGGEIAFQGKILSEGPAAQAVFILRFERQPGSAEIPATIDPEGVARATYSLNEHPLRVFSNLFYRLEVTLADGTVFSSPEVVIYYEDNRFEWQHLAKEPFEVFWYNGDQDFAQEILEVAQAGLLRAQDYLPIENPEWIKIYVYDDPQAMQAALLLSGQSWVAGHALSELGVIQVSLPQGPEQPIEMERQVPHELMHVLLYQADPQGYERLPAWFNEGLASITEGYPNPDYQLLLENAYGKGTLMPVASLCHVFPRDANGALLAYAQSASFTRYLYQHFGRSGLEQLHARYTAGEGCEDGLDLALGSSLAIQENGWRQQTFTENLWLSAFGSLVPWLALLAVFTVGPLIFTFRALRRKPASPALNT